MVNFIGLLGIEKPLLKVQTSWKTPFPNTHAPLPKYYHKQTNKQSDISTLSWSEAHSSILLFWENWNLTEMFPDWIQLSDSRREGNFMYPYHAHV